MEDNDHKVFWQVTCLWPGSWKFEDLKHLIARESTFLDLILHCFIYLLQKVDLDKSNEWIIYQLKNYYFFPFLKLRKAMTSCCLSPSTSANLRLISEYLSCMSFNSCSMCLFLSVNKATWPRNSSGSCVFWDWPLIVSATLPESTSLLQKEYKIKFLFFFILPYNCSFSLLTNFFE